jgi:hypothetical protein
VQFPAKTVDIYIAMRINYRIPGAGKPTLHRALQSILLVAFLKLHQSRSDKNPTAEALKFLFNKIKSGKFRPFYKPAEIDRLFEKEILKKWDGGQHFDNKLDSLLAWGDLVGNIAHFIIASRQVLIDYHSSLPANERTQIAKDARMSLIRIKIIEDWIYYHPEAIKGIVS